MSFGVVPIRFALKLDVVASLLARGGRGRSGRDLGSGLLKVVSTDYVSGKHR